jgi:hypothetical protein
MTKAAFWLLVATVAAVEIGAMVWQLPARKMPLP